MWFVGTVPETKPAPVNDLLDGLSLGLNSSSSPSSNFSVFTVPINYKTLNIKKKHHSICLCETGEEEQKSITAFQSDNLKITFSFRKQPEKPRVTSICATFTNLSSNGYTNFIFQAAVPKVPFICYICHFTQFCSANVIISDNMISSCSVPQFIQLHLDPASSNALPANGNGTITQNLTVTNTQHGQVSPSLSLQIYLVIRFHQIKRKAKYVLVWLLDYLLAHIFFFRKPSTCSTGLDL